MREPVFVQVDVDQIIRASLYRGSFDCESFGLSTALRPDSQLQVFRGARTDMMRLNRLQLAKFVNQTFRASLCNKFRLQRGSDNYENLFRCRTSSCVRRDNRIISETRQLKASLLEGLSQTSLSEQVLATSCFVAEGLC